MRKTGILCAALILALALCGTAAASTLQKGNRGDAVALVQRQLIDLGFLDGEADGVFGSQTAKAVKSFQRWAGLKQNGKLTDKQQGDLRAVWEIATDTSYVSYGGGSEDLSGVYDGHCALNEDLAGRTYFTYCWRHYKAEANLSLLRARPRPPRMAMMLAGNA